MALRARYDSGSRGWEFVRPFRGAPLRPPRAEGVAVIGPVGHPAGPRRVRPGFHQGLGAVAARAARHAQAQGSAAAIRQDVDLGCRSRPGCDPRRDPPLGLGGARRAHVRAHNGAVQPHGGTDPDRPAGRPSGAASRPGRTRGPGGDRQSSPGRTRPATGAKGRHACHPARCFHKKATMGFLAHAYIGTGNQKRMNAAPLGIGHPVIGGRPQANRQREE